MDFDQDDIDAVVSDLAEEHDLEEMQIKAIVEGFLEDLRLRLSMSHPFVDVAKALEARL